MKKIIVSLGIISFALGFPFFAGSVGAAAAEETATLLEAAKKEGKVVWYTTLTTLEADAMGKKFKEKYPFIATEVWRSGAEKVMIRMQGEAQAKKNYADAVMITAAESELMRRKGMFAKYLSPERRSFPEGLKDTEGYWTDLYVNLNVVGYNTKLVAPQDVPKTYEDLLKPRWRGKMGMDTKAYEWFANMLKFFGEKKGLEFMRKLGEQNILFRTGRTLNATMVAAGEVEVGIALYNQRIEEMKAKGAPVQWLAIDPIIPEIHPLSVNALAPHPNAARLLVNYLLSKEGQEVIASFFRIPSRDDVDPIIPNLKKGLKIMPPSFEMVDHYDRYVKLYRELLMRK